jgi:hypothetical protein
MIEDDEIGRVRSNLSSHLLDFPFASISRRIRTLSPPMNLSTDRSARRLGEQTHFFKLFSNIIAPKSS